MNPEVDDDSGDQKIIVGFDERRYMYMQFAIFIYNTALYVQHSIVCPRSVRVEPL